MEKPSALRQAVAQGLLKIAGESRKIFQYKDADDQDEVDIFFDKNNPTIGITTCATIGMSEVDQGFRLPDGKDLRVELIGACGEYKFLPNILSTCAFNLRDHDYPCYPGAVHPHVVEEYYPDFEMKHILFVSPFLWDNLDDIFCENKQITWLMAVPISEAEYVYLEENGSDALENLLEKKDIDVFDLERASVV